MTTQRTSGDASPVEPAFAAYIGEVFGEEDEFLASLMPRATEAGLPDIALSPEAGRTLHLLARLTNGARGPALALELGTLAGYSAIWIARALAPGGRLITLEPEPAHAEFAHQAFLDAGVGNRIEIRRQAALEALPGLRAELGEASLDVVFIDAVKEEYPEYFEHSAPLVKPGGLLIADNVLTSSWRITEPEGADPRRDAVDRFNRMVAGDDRFFAICDPIRAGMLVALRR